MDHRASAVSTTSADQSPTIMVASRNNKASNSNKFGVTMSVMLASLSVFISLFTVVAIADEPVSDLNVASKPIEHCYLKGVSDRLICGSIKVAENPNKPDGKQIDIHYAVIPAIKPSYPQEAMLAIAGGPGQSALDNAAGFDRMLSQVREQRDILLIDQRGTGRSNILSCEVGDINALTYNDDDLDTPAETKKCLQASDNDVTQYGSEIALTDFEAVRQHLGYQKLHIYGVSYGTRMAQLYMRHYPQSIATVSLDGVVPMQQSVFAISNAIERATQLMIKDCKQSATCNEQFPNLQQALNDVDAQLAVAPYKGMVSDPYTSEKTELVFTRSKFQTSIRLALYSTSTRALLPHAIYQASQGDMQAMLGLYSLSIGSLDLAMGMHASVVCGEDLPRITDKIRTQMQATYTGKTMLKGIEETCEIWKMPTVEHSFSEPISSDIPTLLLSGELDPATPPAWGDLATAKLANSLHLVAPYATHNVAAQSCANQLIADLVTSGTVKDIDGSCLDKDVSRSFYLNASSVEVLPSESAVPSKNQTFTESDKAKD
ncbi:alpha/beta hydrolase [Parashewanella spongiae]|uniref:Alpha/beta hydrolase n=1 Tax=Parashewanella spongiae TaxID=342950 RepID=A0A3A6TQH4_9GAMM|nr:alpha/beta hydrolase [Parashewanella spongiae]MCL1078499.1 alpha/beta hydrolase [Parashewanella spongiae]RJY14708.1 alpha/beta hydrolase [Parashewanella spongiae]